MPVKRETDLGDVVGIDLLPPSRRAYLAFECLQLLLQAPGSRLGSQLAGGPRSPRRWPAPAQATLNELHLQLLAYAQLDLVSLPQRACQRLIAPRARRCLRPGVRGTLIGGRVALLSGSRLDPHQNEVAVDGSCRAPPAWSTLSILRRGEAASSTRSMALSEGSGRSVAVWKERFAAQRVRCRDAHAWCC